MSMLKSHFQFKDEDKQSLLSIGGLISALIFVALVGFVLYRSLSTALFTSKRTSATDALQIQDEQLKKALELAEKWEQEASPQIPRESPTQSATPAPSELRIAIRNGTIIPGLASEVAEKLIEAGFTQIIEVGNADRQDYALTVIKIKKSLNSYIDSLRQALFLSADSINVEELQETEESDIVVIIGSEGR